MAACIEVNIKCAACVCVCVHRLCRCLWRHRQQHRAAASERAYVSIEREAEAATQRVCLPLRERERQRQILGTVSRRPFVERGQVRNVNCFFSPVTSKRWARPSLRDVQQIFCYSRLQLREKLKLCLFEMLIRFS